MRIALVVGTCFRRGCRAVSVALSLLLSGTVEASAHGVSPRLGSFYDGLLHVFFAPDQIAALLAVGLWLGLAQRALVRQALGALLAGACVGWLVPVVALRGVPFTLIACIVLVGGFLALNIRPLRLLAVFVSAVLGFAVTAANVSIDSGNGKELVFDTGLLLAQMMLTVCLAAGAYALAHGKPWQIWVLRIAGSWLLAFGLIALAWQLKVVLISSRL